MTWTTHTKQRAAVMPSAARVVPAVDTQLGNGWAGGIATPWDLGNATSHGFTAKRSTRHLGGLST